MSTRMNYRDFRYVIRCKLQNGEDRHFGFDSRDDADQKFKEVFVNGDILKAEIFENNQAIVSTDDIYDMLSNQ